MENFIDALIKNKKSKGKDFDGVLDALAKLEDPNAVFTHNNETYSVLGHAIALTHNEDQALQVSKALVDRGAQANDEQVSGQPHNKSISLALHPPRYELISWLTEHGAHPGDIVHAWIRRPKSVAEANSQLLLEQLLWQHYNQEQRYDRHVHIMVSLMSCEVITGNQTKPDVRKEISEMAYRTAAENDFDNDRYLLSNLDDACGVVRNPERARPRLERTISQWADGIYSDMLEKPTNMRLDYQKIPQSFWDYLPQVRDRNRAMGEANEIHTMTPIVSSTTRSRRI